MHFTFMMNVAGWRSRFTAEQSLGGLPLTAVEGTIGERTHVRSDQALDRAAGGGPQALSALHLKLLGGFAVYCRGNIVHLPVGSQRVVTLLAVQKGPVSRSMVSGTLWSDTPEERATANLRSALWRIPEPVRPIVTVIGTMMTLGSQVTVDVHEMATLAQLARAWEPGNLTRITEADLALLGSEFLPGWYDDWAMVERERLRNLRVRTLEALCQALTREARFHEAVEVGLAAVAAEPLRESAHRILMSAHIAEGNYSEALRQYRWYRALLDKELNLTPSPRMEDLIRFLRSRSVLSLVGIALAVQAISGC